MSHERFEAPLWPRALDLIPDELPTPTNNLAVCRVDRSPNRSRLLGLYDGIPLTGPEHYGGMIMPDRISIYRLAICDICTDEDEIVEQVRITVIHEVAHHFGIDDDRLEELGWD